MVAVGGFDPECLVEDYELIHRMRRYALGQGLDWRFRVLGDAAKIELKRVASEVAAGSAPDGSDRELVGAVAAKKLDRAPTIRRKR